MCFRLLLHPAGSDRLPLYQDIYRSNVQAKEEKPSCPGISIYQFNRLFPFRAHERKNPSIYIYIKTVYTAFRKGSPRWPLSFQTLFCFILKSTCKYFHFIYYKYLYTKYVYIILILDISVTTFLSQDYPMKRRCAFKSVWKYLNTCKHPHNAPKYACLSSSY